MPHPQWAKPNHTSPSIMAVAPLAPVAVGFILGVLIDARWDVSPYTFLMILLFATALVFVRRLQRLVPVVMLLVGLATGGFIHHARVVRPQSTIERFATQHGLVTRVRGGVASPPQLRTGDPGPLSIRAFRSERTNFLLDVESVESDDGWIRTGGAVRVTVREALLDLNEGERVEVSGRLHRLHEPSNPGAFDWAGYMRRRGVVATLVAPHRENIRRIGYPTTSTVSRLVTWVRSRFRGMLIDDLVTSGDTEAGLLAAMVLGHRSSLDREINDIFIRSGCAHFLAVSGVHIVIVIMIVGLGCRAVELTGRKQTAVMMLAVAMYAVIAEPRPSIMRASIIAEIYFISRWLYRESARLNWISATVLVLGVIDPDMIFDLGYQLSTAAVLGIFFLPQATKTALRGIKEVCTPPREADPSKELLDRLIANGRTRWQQSRHDTRVWFRAFLFEVWLISVAAWLATWPILVAYFGRVHPLAPLASIVMFPILTVLMFVGFLKLALALVAPPLATQLSLVADSLDSFAVYVADALGSLPYATVKTPEPTWWAIACYYAGLIAFVSYWRRSRGPTEDIPPLATEALIAEIVGRTRQVTRRTIRIALTVTTLGAVVIFSTFHWPSHTPTQLRMTVLDVGAGSAIVLELPTGETVMYDTGTLGPVDVGRTVVAPFLQHRGIDRVDRAFVSHANLDHYNGIPSVGAVVPITEVFTNAYFAPDAEAGSMVDRWRQLTYATGAHLLTLDATKRTWHYGGATFELLWPPPGTDLTLKSNDTSTVLRVSYGTGSILLTGDIEDAAQRALIDNGDLHADVLLAPHHGSVRSSSGAFYAAVGATTIIRSSRERTRDTINGLVELTEGTTLLNTADVGAVEVIIDETGVRAHGFRR